jgi:hypothetical protein
MPADTLIPLCKLYENTSKAGRKYYVGNLSFTAKLVLLQNLDATDGAPQWTLYISERTPKPTTERTP